MKKLVYVKAEWCPYCSMASRWLNNLLLSKEEYKNFELEVVDIDQDKERAKDFPHELVPNFWLDGEKIFEGVPTRPGIRAILDKAAGIENTEEEVKTEE